VRTTTYLTIVPAFNENPTVGKVIGEIRKTVPFSDILIVDDGSTDGTGGIAREEGARVISHPFNLGYGAALQTGFRYAKKKGYEFAFIMDADGQHISSSAMNLISAMEDHGADVVIGSRFIGNGYPLGTARKIGIKLFSYVARLYTGINITDPTSGFQLLRKSAFSFLADGDNYPLDYPDVNIIMALHKKKFRIIEAPVTMIENRSGKSMHGGLRPVFYVAKMFLAIIMVMVRRTAK
jgi:glycosyltransferase involved in cell wall biosynthesis